MEDRLPVKARVVALLRQKDLTLFAAESCTGGLVTKELTDVPGASTVLYGGVVSYVNDIKQAVLGVSSETLERFTAVSEPCAREMAEGARRLSGCDIGVSTTGYASGGEGVPSDMVGVVFVGIADGKSTEVHRLRLTGDRDAVRRGAVEALFALLWERLTEKRKNDSL